MKFFPFVAVAALAVGAAPAHADTYKTEFVHPDGSARVCTTSFYSTSTSTRCVNLTAKQREAGQLALIAGYDRIIHCADRDTAEDWRSISFEERNRMWDTCMGR